MSNFETVLLLMSDSLGLNLKELLVLREFQTLTILLKLMYEGGRTVNVNNLTSSDLILYKPFTTCDFFQNPTQFFTDLGIQEHSVVTKLPVPAPIDLNVSAKLLQFVIVLAYRGEHDKKFDPKVMNLINDFEGNYELNSFLFKISLKFGFMERICHQSNKHIWTCYSFYQQFHAYKDCLANGCSFKESLHEELIEKFKIFNHLVPNNVFTIE